MASLTQVAITTRKVVRYGIYFAIFLLIGKVVFDTTFRIYRRFFPPAPPPPTVKFGKLPKLPFPDRPKISNLTFTLETPEGGLPKLSTQAKVYLVPKVSSSLLSLDVAKDRVNSLGFKPEPQVVSEAVYRFPHKSSPSNLEMNIVTGTFSISYDLASDSSPLEKRPPVAEVAASEIRSYLSSANLLPDDLTGPTTHEFLRVQEGKFISAISQSEADLVKINFFRKTYDNLPVLTPDPSQANVWFIVSGRQEREKRVIAAEFHYFPVDENQFSTYPLITPQEAWDELSNGAFFLANLGPNKDGDSITIRRVYLAYYDAGVPTEFFQPVFVFEGDRGFVAYVPAVAPDYYGE